MYELKPGHILLAEKTRGWKLSNFFPFAIRLITGNKITHVAIVESCDLNSVSYWDANSGKGVKCSLVPNMENSKEGGLLLANDMVVTKVAELPLIDIIHVSAIINELHLLEGSKYNYASILTLMKDHILRQFYTLPTTKPDSSFGRKFTCSQLVTHLLLKAGFPFSRLFTTVTYPALVEPDNFTTAPFVVIPLSELKRG
jgi:hypothetical protein